MFAHNHNARAVAHARVVRFVALAILALLFVPILGAAVVADLHSGGAVLAFGPLSLIGGRMVCTGPLLKAEDGGTGGGGALTDAEFRTRAATALDAIEKRGQATEKELADVKEWRTKAEALFSDRDKAREDIDTLTKKFTELQRTADALRANRDPNESPREYLRRAFPGECKEIAEAYRAQRNHEVHKAETTATTQSGASNVSLSGQIYSLTAAVGAFRNMDAHSIQAGTENFVVETGEPDMGFVAENGDIPEGALALTTAGRAPKKLAGYIAVSLESVQDTSYDLGAYIAEKLSRAAARRSDYVALLGTGANDYNNGTFFGIVNSPGVLTTTTGAGHTKLSTTTSDEVVDWTLSLSQGNLDNKPVIFMNTVMCARFAKIKDGNGRPVFMNALDAPAYGAIGSINGFPVIPTSVLPYADAAGAIVGIIGDPKAYAVGIRKDYTFDFSDHFLFKNGMRAYRAWMRAAYFAKDASKFAVLKLAAA